MQKNNRPEGGAQKTSDPYLNFFKLCILALKSNTQLLLRLAVGTAFSGSLNHRSIENPARQKTSRYFA